MKRDFKTVGGTVVRGVVTAHVPAALLPEAITQSGDSRMGCVWLPAMGACRLSCLREPKLVTLPCQAATVMAGERMYGPFSHDGAGWWPLAEG